jgi:hypothetical protein
MPRRSDKKDSVVGTFNATPLEGGSTATATDEVTEIITLPQFDEKGEL